MPSIRTREIFVSRLFTEKGHEQLSYCNDRGKQAGYPPEAIGENSCEKFQLERDRQAPTLLSRYDYQLCFSGDPSRLALPL